MYSVVCQAAANAVGAGEALAQNDTVAAKGYFVKMQDDGNLVVYTEDNKALWASNTSGKGTGPFKATLQADGDFVVNDSTGAAIWAANTKDKGGVSVKIQEDGNFVMYTKDEKPVWCTRTDGGQESPVGGVGEM